MNVYFDMEFTGLKKDTTIISVGMIAENGEKFYGEIVDYDHSQLDEWLIKNVITNLWSVTKTIEECSSVEYFYVGTKNQIADYLKKWLSQFEDVQFVSDVCHYDMVLLIDLFGGAFDLPSNVSPACHDINQDIARCLNISDRKAFDVNRECFLGICDSEGKHNALHDAEIIKKIYETTKY